MTSNYDTPAAVLFDLMKRYGGVSNRELGAMLLSGRPLADGHSPQSRVEDRTWLSRFVVHAPVSSLDDRLFRDYTTAALRIASHLDSSKKAARGRTSVVAAVFGEEGRAMDCSLEAAGQDAVVYRNMLERIRQEKTLSDTERVEAALVLVVTAACTADVARAVTEVQGFALSMFGSEIMTPVPDRALLLQEQESREGVPEPWLGLLRVDNGLVVGRPQWVDPNSSGTEIGSLASAQGAISAVGPDVSGLHARLWHDEEGRWWVEGAESKNGTVLVSGLSGEEVVVEPPACARKDWESHPVELKVGDQLRFGQSTTFVLIEGFPE